MRIRENTLDGLISVMTSYVLSQTEEETRAEHSSAFHFL